MIRILLACALSVTFTNVVMSDVVFTTEGIFSVGTESYDRGDLVMYVEETSNSSMYFDRDTITGGSQNIAAMHYGSVDSVIFATTGTSTIGSNTYSRGDLIKYDMSSGTSSLFFDRDTITSGNRSIAAVYVESNDIYFTTNGIFSIGGNSFDRGDLVQYNTITGTASLFFDRDLITGGNDDLTGAHILDDGDLLFTTRGSSTIGGMSFERGDVIRYDFTTGTASLYFDRDNVTGGNRFITALAIVPEPASCMLVSLLLGGLLFRQRRRTV